MLERPVVQVSLSITGSLIAKEELNNDALTGHWWDRPQGNAAR
jgi:hypothetical protein